METAKKKEDKPKFATPKDLKESEKKKFKTPKEMAEQERLQHQMALKDLDKSLSELDTVGLTSKGGSVILQRTRTFNDAEREFIIKWFAAFSWVAVLSEEGLQTTKIDLTPMPE